VFDFFVVTIPLSASVGKYAIVARNKGAEWYVGAMTNSETRDVEIDFSFLPEGVELTAEIYRDAEFSDTNAKLYKIRNNYSNKSIKINLSSGG
jgi:alpha-glucosidase